MNPPHFFFNPKTSFAPKTPKPTTPIHWNPTPKPNSWNQILQILEPKPPNRDRSGSHIAMELSKVARNEAHASTHQSEPNSLLSLSLSLSLSPKPRSRMSHERTHSSIPPFIYPCIHSLYPVIHHHHLLRKSVLGQQHWFVCVEVLRKDERELETQFTTKIGG
jgi:hypothetical protein